MDWIHVLLGGALILILVLDVLDRRKQSSTACIRWEKVSLEMTLLCECGGFMDFKFVDSEVRELTCIHCKKRWGLPTCIELTDMENFSGQGSK